MPESHRALIGIKSYSNDGLSLLKKVFENLQSMCEFARISSVYKVKGEHRSPAHVHDLKKVSSFDGLSVVASVETSLDPASFLQQLREVQNQHESPGEHRSVSINLLTFDDLTLMTAQLTLPHPDFHDKPEVLFPAAEVSGDLVHPVLNESLRGLTKRFANLRWGEFYSQGKTLLDFSQPQT